MDHPPNTCSDDFVLSYNVHLAHMLNHFVPLKTYTVTFLRSAPCFTPELRKMKAAGCQLERLRKKTGLTVHRQAYKAHVLAYKEALTKPNLCIIPPLLLEDRANKILQPTKPFPLTPSTDICCKFLHFFQNKITAIYR